MSELVEVADRLYAVTPEDFLSTRTALAAQCEDKQLAAAVRKLRKPAVAAWAVNLLVRREPGQLGDALGIAEALRTAAQSLDGDELRTLTKQRRQLTIALAGTARSLAREEGTRLTQQSVDAVEGMLTAAMLDASAAELLQTGRVLKAFSSTGMSTLDPGELVAVPEAVDVHATPVQPPEPGPAQLTVVQGGAVELEKAQEEEQAAKASLDEAEAELAEVQGSEEELQARRLQLQGDIDELRRRVADLEESVDQVDEDLETAEAAREDAAAVRDEARETWEKAAQKVRSLED